MGSRRRRRSPNDLIPHAASRGRSGGEIRAAKGPISGEHLGIGSRPRMNYAPYNPPGRRSSRSVTSGGLPRRPRSRRRADIRRDRRPCAGPHPARRRFRRVDFRRAGVKNGIPRDPAQAPSAVRHLGLSGRRTSASASAGVTDRWSRPIRKTSTSASRRLAPRPRRCAGASCWCCSSSSCWRRWCTASPTWRTGRDTPGNRGARARPPSRWRSSTRRGSSAGRRSSSAWRPSRWRPPWSTSGPSESSRARAGRGSRWPGGPTSPARGSRIPGWARASSSTRSGGSSSPTTTSSRTPTRSSSG